MGMVHPVAELELGVVRFERRRLRHQGTAKIAILMTDGEYNTQYDVNGINTDRTPGAGAAANGTSATQAKALCTGMKAKGIEVYTVGFGRRHHQQRQGRADQTARPMQASTTTPRTMRS